jgi:hypothetical protein
VKRYFLTKAHCIKEESLKTLYARGNNKYIKDSAQLCYMAETHANNNCEELGMKLTLHLLSILQMNEIRHIDFSTAKF